MAFALGGGTLAAILASGNLSLLALPKTMFSGIDIFAHMISDVDDELVALFKAHPNVAVLSALGGAYTITVNDLKPFRADTVGKPLPGMEVRIINPASDGVGEVSVRSKTVMAGYLNEPELTAESAPGKRLGV